MLIPSPNPHVRWHVVAKEGQVADGRYSPGGVRRGGGGVQGVQVSP